MRIVTAVALVSLGFATLTPVSAQTPAPVAYPAKGQSSQLQGSDKAACQSWAQKESGFDPATPPPAKPQVAKARGGMLRGAVVGAAAGELINDDAGKGAAVGATAGGVRQGVRNHGAQASVDADYQAKLAAYQNGQAAFSKAYGACMEGRGYTVK